MNHPQFLVRSHHSTARWWRLIVVIHGSSEPGWRRISWQMGTTPTNIVKLEAELTYSKRALHRTWYRQLTSSNMVASKSTRVGYWGIVLPLLHIYLESSTNNKCWKTPIKMCSSRFRHSTAWWELQTSDCWRSGEKTKVPHDATLQTFVPVTWLSLPCKKCCEVASL